MIVHMSVRSISCSQAKRFVSIIQYFYRHPKLPIPGSELDSACFLQLALTMSGIANPEKSSFNITTAC